jgi:hypothetical protein
MAYTFWPQRSRPEGWDAKSRTARGSAPDAPLSPEDGTRTLASRVASLRRHTALADEAQAAGQLADDLQLGRRDRRPLPRPDARLSPLGRVEGVLLPDVALFVV